MENSESEKQTLAQTLKKAREDAHLEIKELSEMLKIPGKYIIHLEKGNYEKLPGKAYIFGFLNKYASTLNLNSEELINEYKKERPQETRETPLPILKTGKPIITPKIIIYFIIIIAVGLAFFYFLRQISVLINPPRLTIESPSEEIVDNPNITIKGLTDQRVKLTINDVEVYVNEKGEFQKDFELQTGLNIFKIKAENNLKKEQVLIKNIWLKKKE